MNLPRVKLEIAGHALEAYVARTAQERALGLMHRQELPDNEGMLFMGDAPAPQSFWMKDTPLPLSAAFLHEDGTIVQLEDLQPHSLQPCRCQVPVRFVLEVNQGWFAQRGIEAGARVAGPPFLG
jgi:uncharacterized protein